MLAVLLVVLGILSRMVTHGFNFTPVLAVALFSGAYISDRRVAVAIPLLLMLVTDFLIGWHQTMPFTWGSIILISVIGFWLREKRTAGRVILSAIVSSVVFFIITNFGAFLYVGYPQTWAGLIECYTAAIPFFRTTLLSTLVFSAILFGVYEVCAFYLKKTRYAKILLAR